MKKPKSNKARIIIIIVAIIVGLVALALVLILCLRKKSKDNIKRTLNYYLEHNEFLFYSFVEKSNYFQVLEKIMVACFSGPCNPKTNYTKDIKDKEEIKNLTILFDEVFKNTTAKKKKFMKMN